MSDDSRDKILKLLRLTTSDSDGEALNAIRIANKLLKKDKCDWGDMFGGGGGSRIVYVDRVVEKVVYRDREKGPKKMDKTDKVKEWRDDLETARNFAEYNDSFDDSFISSLEEQFSSRGFLTDKQHAALRKIIERWNM